MGAVPLFDLRHTHPAVAKRLEVQAVPWAILDEIGTLTEAVGRMGVALGALWERQTGVWVGREVRIARDVTLTPPCVILDGSEIRPNAYLRGNTLIGEGCVVGNATEIKNAILFDGVQAPHFSYIGDSVLGYRAHLGAGVILSNLRLDRAEVRGAWEPPYPTGRRKAGALIGDGAEIGCHSVISPGALIPPGARIPPLTHVTGRWRQTEK